MADGNGSRHRVSFAPVRYAWLAVIAVSLVPVAIVGLFANPLVFMVLGPDVWRDRMQKLRPYRDVLALSIVVCAFATTVYTLAYA